MSDPNEPPRPEGPSGDVPPPPPPPPSGDSPYGAAGGAGGYGDQGYGGAAGYGGGGYGAPPPQPNPYGQPDPNAYSPTNAVGFGWRHFTAKPATLLVPTLVIGIAVLVVSWLVQVIVVGGMTDSGSSFSAVLVAGAIASAITTVIVSVLSAGLYKGGFAVADGRDFSLGQLFEGWDKLQVFIAALIIGLLTLVGTVLCYFPALLVQYFTLFTIPYIVDK